MELSLRPAIPEDYPALTRIWRSAVEATHGFLTAEQIDGFELRIASEFFPAVKLVVATANEKPAGFSGTADGDLAMLFISDTFRGNGLGTLLVQEALSQTPELTVDVNEQNPQAVGFYLSQGFKVIGRSDLDTDGNPFPLIHLKHRHPVPVPLPDIEVFADGDPGEIPWVDEPPVPEPVKVVPYDRHWPVRYASVAGLICQHLGNVAISVEHVGSTAVPGLSAKNVIDIDLIVADPTDEDSYVPMLNILGFKHTIREPSWYQHRMLRLDDPAVNLHVFGPLAAEPVRHILFRDWLKTHPQDLRRYAEAKLAAAVGVDLVAEYNARKESVIREIYASIFAGLSGR